MVKRVAPTFFFYFDYTQGKLQMGSIKGRTLPINYLRPDEKHIPFLPNTMRNYHHRVMRAHSDSDKLGAGDGDRTRDFLLGKEMLYH